MYIIFWVTSEKGAGGHALLGDCIAFITYFCSGNLEDPMAVIPLEQSDFCLAEIFLQNLLHLLIYLLVVNFRGL